MKSKMVKILGLTTSIIGVTVTLLSDWVNEQKMDEKIEEKINEALTERKDENEEP